MRHISAIPSHQLINIRYLLTDIDDTMSDAGLLPSTSLSAIENLDRAGITVIPVTGRSAGWCDHIARMWPVKGVVGENGAFYFSYDRSKNRMRRVFARDDRQREADRLRLNQVRDRILNEIPGSGIASDQHYRVADLAIDFCEDVKPLPVENVKHIVRIFKEYGANAKISTIHVNGWFGAYDKLTTTRVCLSELCAVDIDEDNEMIAFIGDSPNDVPMFSFFTNSVGVANVNDFELDAEPRWVTEKRSARGFREFADLLLGAQQGQ